MRQDAIRPGSGIRDNGASRVFPDPIPVGGAATHSQMWTTRDRDLGQKISAIMQRTEPPP